MHRQVCLQQLKVEKYANFFFFFTCSPVSFCLTVLSWNVIVFNLCLYSHLPGWPRPGGVFLQLPPLHIQVQVPRLSLQVRVWSSWLDTLFQHDVNNESSNHRQLTQNHCKVITDTVRKCRPKAGSIHSHYSIDVKTAVRLETLPPNYTSRSAKASFSRERSRCASHTLAGTQTVSKDTKDSSFSLYFWILKSMCQPWRACSVRLTWWMFGECLDKKRFKVRQKTLQDPCRNPPQGLDWTEEAEGSSPGQIIYCHGSTNPVVTCGLKEDQTACRCGHFPPLES